MTDDGVTSSDGTERFWDHEDCPRDDCDGELQQQDEFNVMCLSCEWAWVHIKTGTKHQLQTKRGELVAEKPRIVTDGGTDRSEDDYTVGEKIVHVEGDTGRPEVFVEVRPEDVGPGEDVTLMRNSDARELYEKLGEYLDDGEQTPQEEWEEHNESFNYEPPQRPPEAWSSEEFQELCDRVISRRTKWICDECSGRGPFRSLQKARWHVESQHGAALAEMHAPDEDELETATDGGTSEERTAKRSEANHGLGDFSGGDE